MTLNQLALILLRENSRSTDDPDLVSVTEDWISDAIAEIGNTSEWKFFQKEYSFNTVASQATYTLPAEALDLKYLRVVSTDLEIVYIDPETLVHYSQDLEQTTSTPEFWWYESAGAIADAPLIIHIHPVPSSIIPMSAPYYFHPGVLASGDTIPVPRNRLLVIKERVRARFHLEDKEFASYDRVIADFRQKLAAAIVDERGKHARTYTLGTNDLPKRNRYYTRFDPGHYQN